MAPAFLLKNCDCTQTVHSRICAGKFQFRYFTFGKLEKNKGGLQAAFIRSIS